MRVNVETTPRAAPEDAIRSIDVSRAAAEKFPIALVIGKVFDHLFDVIIVLISESAPDIIDVALHSLIESAGSNQFGMTS